MLRAGQKININLPIHSENGFILAPVINLLGIILRADKPIPTAIQTFLEEKGAIINRVNYKGEGYVKIQGEWRLTAEEANAFVATNAALIAEQNVNLDRALVAQHLKTEILEHITEVRKNHAFFSYTHDDHCMEAKFSVIYSPTENHLTTPATIKGGAFIVCDKKTILTASALLHTGVENREASIGIFASIASGTTIDTMVQNADLQNSVTQAGTVLSFSSRMPNTANHQLTLKINDTVTWMNRPHRDCAIVPLRFSRRPQDVNNPMTITNVVETEATAVPQNTPTLT